MTARIVTKHQRGVLLWKQAVFIEHRPHTQPLPDRRRLAHTRNTACRAHPASSPSCQGRRTRPRGHAPPAAASGKCLTSLSRGPVGPSASSSTSHHLPQQLREDTKQGPRSNQGRACNLRPPSRRPPPISFSKEGPTHNSAWPHTNIATRPSPWGPSVIHTQQQCHYPHRRCALSAGSA